MVAHRITSLYRFLLLLSMSIALMVVDHRSDWFVPVRTFSSVFNLPFQMLINLPRTTGKFIKRYYPDDSLPRKYAALVEKQLILEIRLQRYTALQFENERLSKLLSAQRKSEAPGLLAEIIEIGLQPFTHQVAINRGVEAGVYLGQPVLTPQGILGQVSEVGVLHSVVTLLTDPSHAIPVQVQRNGLRTIVHGTGASGQINVPFLSSNADIRNSDILVTSGVGERFPAGFKVAQVHEIIVDANADFLNIQANMFANVEFTKEVLLLWHQQVGARTHNSEQASE